MAPNVNLCLVVLDVEGFAWRECCYAIYFFGGCELWSEEFHHICMYVCMALGMWMGH
jgi:hypothetical protein